MFDDVIARSSWFQVGTGRESNAWGSTENYNAVDAANEGIVAEGSSEVKECFCAWSGHSRLISAQAVRMVCVAGGSERRVGRALLGAYGQSATMLCLESGFPVCSYLDDK